MLLVLSACCSPEEVFCGSLEVFLCGKMCIELCRWGEVKCGWIYGGILHLIRGLISGVILCRVWMCVHGMSETLCFGVHWRVVKRGSCMGWYVDMGGTNALRLRACFEVMLLPKRELRNPTIDAGCSDSLCRESEAWAMAFFSVDGRCRALGLDFWLYLTTDGGGFANTHFLEARGVAWCVGNPLPLTVRVHPLLDLVIPRFPFCDYIKIRNIM